MRLSLPGIVTDGTNIGKADYVHPVVEAMKQLDHSLILLRLEDGSYTNWEHKQAGDFDNTLQSEFYRQKHCSICCNMRIPFLHRSISVCLKEDLRAAHAR